MSLLQIQVLLARLYTDPVLQQRFFEAPEVVGKEFFENFLKFLI